MMLRHKSNAYALLPDERRLFVLVVVPFHVLDSRRDGLARGSIAIRIGRSIALDVGRSYGDWYAPAVEVLHRPSRRA